LYSQIIIRIIVISTDENIKTRDVCASIYNIMGRELVKGAGQIF
jgi:hypothetical protein